VFNSLQLVVTACNRPSRGYDALHYTKIAVKK